MNCGLDRVIRGAVFSNSGRDAVYTLLLVFSCSVVSDSL